MSGGGGWETALNTALRGGIDSIASYFGGPAGGIAANAGLNMVAPGSAGTPSQSTIANALSSNPGLAGISPNMVTGISQNQAPAPAGGAAAPAATTGAPASSQPTWQQLSIAGSKDVGDTYLQYVAGRNLKRTSDPTAWAPEHSTPVGSQPNLGLLPVSQPSIPAQF